MYSNILITDQGRFELNVNASSNVDELHFPTRYEYASTSRVKTSIEIFFSILQGIKNLIKNIFCNIVRLLNF